MGLTDATTVRGAPGNPLAGDYVSANRRRASGVSRQLNRELMVRLHDRRASEVTPDWIGCD